MATLSADAVKFAVSATPVEVLADENAVNHEVIASEVGRILGGSGVSVSLTNYAGTGAVQGYTNAAPNYVTASQNAAGSRLSTRNMGDFLFIKNTGYLFSSSSVLGAASTNYVIVAARMEAYSADPAQGGFYSKAGTGRSQYIEIATLKPGQAIVLPLGGASLGVTQFGSTAADFNKLNQAGATDEDGSSLIYCKTIASDGSAASAANAMEFLCVD